MKAPRQYQAEPVRSVCVVDRVIHVGGEVETVWKHAGALAAIVTAATIAAVLVWFGSMWWGA